MIDEDLDRKLKSWFRQDWAHAQKFHREAREDFEFYNGKQWNDEDAEYLRSQRRPIMTFNRIAPLVNAVIGSERNNKREVRFIPRQVGKALPNELLTSAAEWFRDEADGENEDSDAFGDAVICGMGWTDTRLSYDDSADGKPVISRLDPLKMAWDCHSVKPNLIDATRMWFVDKKPLSVAKTMFPDIDRESLDAGNWLDSGTHDPIISDPTRYYSGINDGKLDETNDCEVTLIECRWFERKKFYRVNIPDVAGNITTQDFSEEQFKANPGVEYVTYYRKVAKRAFLGANLLEEPDEPLAPQGQLGWECITAYQDKKSNLFYGVVRATKDPQRWANKFFSQVMHILNSQAKGGIIAERGAFDDDRQAEQSLASSDTITWVSNGGLDRIQPKPSSVFPAGFFQLFNESKEAISQVTGLSPEFVGTREVNQAGVLEAQRRQSSLNLLANLFDSLKRYRIRQGKIILYLVQNYLSDGRLIRIVGEDLSQYVPLTREAITNLEYDIIVDDAPTSPNEKERTFSIIQSMLPILKDYITPEIGLDILRYSPVPASLVDRWTNALQKQQEEQQQQQQQQPQQPTPQEQVEQLKLQGIQAAVQGKIAAQQTSLQGKQLNLQAQALAAQAKAAESAIKQQELALRQDKVNKDAENAAQQRAIEEVQNAIRQQNANTNRVKGL